LSDTAKEADRQLKICNACRYCEGYCAVWPAMERRTDFKRGDVAYLANLCYNCRECYYACPFVPPHEFAINIPQILSQARLETYEAQSTPKGTSSFFRRPWLFSAVVGILGIALLFIFASLMGNPSRIFSTQLGAGSFYVIIPYLVIIGAGLGVGAYVLYTYALELRSFLASIDLKLGDFFKPEAFFLASADALKHTFFRGGGAGCNYPGEKGQYSYMSLHMMVFYGFLSAIVSTILAGIYQDYLHIMPPYAIATPPVLFGIAGGVLMVAATSVLLYYKVISDKAPSLKKMLSLDTAFLLTLDVTSITGFLVLFLRSTSAMGSMFLLHLGLVLALFVTAPYGKFAHAFYRFASLVKNRVEELHAIK